MMSAPWQFHIISIPSPLFCFGPLNIELRERESEKIGRWYGADQKASYICSFSSLCLMDQVSCSMESRCDDRCVAAGREIIFAELFSRVRVIDRVNQSYRELQTS